MKKVIKYIIYFFILIVLCCAMCYFTNLHKEHKLLKIEDEEALKKENISVDISTKDLEENKNKIEELKTKIQNEMINIDNTYEKVDKEVTKSYEIKHENLIKEEERLKDKLKNEVTKIKENLENNLSKINETIRNIERIIKGKKIFLEKKDEIMIKQLNYISNINKNQKQMKILIQQPIKNLKILYNENERQIKYEEYYFNGLPIPKNIQITDINSNSFKLSWEIDNLNILNIDNKQIKYKVELKKENSNHKKENIDYILPIDTRCPEHPKIPLNLFCLDEKGN